MTVEPLSSYSAAMRSALGCLCALRKLQRGAVLFLGEARHAHFQGKASEVATQVQLCVAMLFDFAAGYFSSGLRRR